jgi:hypothetical protein
MDQNQKILNYLRKTFVGKEHREEKVTDYGEIVHLDYEGLKVEFCEGWFLIFIKELDSSEYPYISAKPLMGPIYKRLREYMEIRVVIVNMTDKYIHPDLSVPESVKDFIRNNLQESTMKKNIILTEAQAKRLVDRIVQEQASTPKPGATPINGPAAAAAAPVSDVSAPEQGETDGLPASDASADTLNPPVPGGEDSASGPVSADAGGDMSGGGGAIGGSGDPFGDGGAGATSNSKVSVWNSGVSRSVGNQISSTSKWSDLISPQRGVANQVSGTSKWSDLISIQRGKANQLN